MLGESGENYLEAILILKETQGLVRSIDVAGFLGVTKPSVSRAISILKGQNLVEMAPSGELTLTDEGYAIASSVYDRHKVLTEFLVALGVDRDIAAEDACRMEHVISQESFERLKQYAQERMA